MLHSFYKRSELRPGVEECYYFDVPHVLSENDLRRIRFLLSEPGAEVTRESSLHGDVLEKGPRVEIETPFSSKAVQICRTIGINASRVEVSTRRKTNGDRQHLIETTVDHLIEAVYESPLTTFVTGKQREPVHYIPILAQGEAAMREANREMSLGMDDWDISHWTSVFQRLGFDPSDAAVLQTANSNSDHSRHWFWGGIHVIDGVEMPFSLMDLAKRAWKANPGLCIDAFCDNAGAIRGYEVDLMLPISPGKPSSFHLVRLRVNPSATAETHNHPTRVKAKPGAATGGLGRQRDDFSRGRGALWCAGVAGYGVGLLHLPGYEIPGEAANPPRDPRYPYPREVLIEGSNGIAEAGNEVGEPLIGGFCRSFGMEVDSAWMEYQKPILYSGGLGFVLDMHTKKHSPEKGMRLVQNGGPMYPIGIGGGSMSSITGGAASLEADRKSVQRANAEQQNRANRVIRTSSELLDKNPIESIHDQGAGGPANVLTELCDPAGAELDIAKLTLGDPTMSVSAAWCAEAQERYGLLVRPENMPLVRDISERERSNCEDLGAITGLERITVRDSRDSTTPVDLPLKDFLSQLPRKRFVSQRITRNLKPLELPHDLTIREATVRTSKQLAVCFKNFKLRKADSAVTGLVALQPRVGRKHVPVADAGVIASSYFGVTGAAEALGENPNKILINPAAGARGAMAEMLLNMACVRISALKEVTFRANWMWPARKPGQAAFIYEAAEAVSEFSLALDIRQDGGKDSSSLSVEFDGISVLSPGEIVIKGYANVPDIRKIVTPDLKGEGIIGYLDLGCGKNRLGGSALAQSFGQLGNECPDIEADLLKRAFNAVQRMIDDNLITAYHDRSDGGLITTLIEMCLAGNRGARIDLLHQEDVLAQLFAEEAGIVFEFPHEHAQQIAEVITAFGLGWHSVRLGTSGLKSDRTFSITVAGTPAFEEDLATLRRWWEATSDELEKQQANLETIAAEITSYDNLDDPNYVVPFTPTVYISLGRRPKIAILREEGSNGDREMTAAFKKANCDPVDVLMQDILNGDLTSFDAFQGLASVGGFSFGDTFGSGKGWAGSILFKARVNEMFERFYERSDTFSLGVCNGCQEMSFLRQVPYRGIRPEAQPRLMKNLSGRFESRWSTVQICKSPSIFFLDMEGMRFGIHVDHCEGRWMFPDASILEYVRCNDLIPVVYVDPKGEPTEAYPYNPNGSPYGIAALCSENGRHLPMMPHPERCFLPWQCHWLPDEYRSLDASPWLRMFQNARNWCLQN